MGPGGARRATWAQGSPEGQRGPGGSGAIRPSVRLCRWFLLLVACGVDVAGGVTDADVVMDGVGDDDGEPEAVGDGDGAGLRMNEAMVCPINPTVAVESLALTK